MSSGTILSIAAVLWIGLWAGSCWYFYEIGWMKGNSAANRSAAEFYDAMKAARSKK